MASYLLSRTARRDLADIWRYYDDLSGQHLANQVIARLHYRFELLAEFPLMGRERSEYLVGIRSFILPNPAYTIFYFPLEGQIEIAYVVNSSRDLEGKLLEQSP